MADITMCLGIGCELKETCFRHKANKSEWQTYIDVPPFNKPDICEYYWSFGTQEQLDELNTENADWP